jgi:hypothetical protein
MSRKVFDYAVAAGRPLLQLLRLCWKARRPVLLKGHTGIGKSELLKHFAAQQAIACIIRDLSLMEPPDLVGMPQLADGRTRFLPPAFLPTAGQGLLVLEEVNRAPEFMRGPCLQLLTERALNDYRLPEGWLPVAAINPADDGYDAAELDPALLSRFVQITVVPDRQEWLTWARAGGIHEDVIAFVNANPSVFGTVPSNPRAWHYVSDLLHKAAEFCTPSELLQAAVAGCVGVEMAVAFARFRRGGDEPLTADQVLSAYRTHGKRLRGWVEAGKTDLVDATLKKVLTRLQAETHFAEVRDDKKSWQNLSRFLADLPGDLRRSAEEFFRERCYDRPPYQNRGTP